MRKKPLIVGVIAALLIFIGALTIYRIFFIWFVRVPVGSMMNTIIPGDYLVVNKSFGAIARGRIVVFQYPGDSEWYVARVVGLPGETIQIRGKDVYVDERILDEQRVTVRESEVDFYKPLEEISTTGDGPYRVFYSEQQGSVADESAEFGTLSAFRIPNESYFVLGDNRDNSADSRFRGAVPRRLIWGAPSVIYYSESMDFNKVRWERIGKKIK